MRSFSLSFVIGTAFALLFVFPVLGDDLPKRKSGLWEIKTSSAAMRDEARSIELCIDQKGDNVIGQAAASARNLCSKSDVHRTGDRMTVDSVCKFGQTTATTHSVITGNFDTAYRVETTSDFDPPMGGMKQSVATIDARWVGPCKSDQRPGDMILGNGTKININDTSKGQIVPPKAR